MENNTEVLAALKKAREGFATGIRQLEEKKAHIEAAIANAKNQIEIIDGQISKL